MSNNDLKVVKMLPVTWSADEFFKKGKGIVTLCGSTRYFEQCMKLNRELTFKGWIVQMCGSWGHSYHKNLESGLSEDDYKEVKKLHFKKIIISNAIIVVSDETGYYGESTTLEIEYAKSQEIPIFYYDGKHLTGETYEMPLNWLSQIDLILEGIESRLEFRWK